MAIIDRVHELLAPVVADTGAQLYDIEFNGGVLRLLVDDEGGISIDKIKIISRAASRLLDETDPIPGRYTLEVSSPGLERPLRTAAHFGSAIDVLVKVKTQTDVGGSRRFTGTVRAVDEDGVEIEVDGETVRLDYTNITKARTVFEWGPTPKPGGPKPGKSPKPSNPHKESAS